MNMRIHQLNRN